MLIRSALALVSLLPAAAIAAGFPSDVDVWGSRSALSFEPNRGQTDSSVRYLAHTGNGIIFFTNSAVVVSGHRQPASFELAGADESATWEPMETTGQSTSYHIGRDSSRWVEGVERYRRLTRHEVYPGIDVVYYGKGNRLEYDFEAAPHADVSRIRLKFTGASRLSIAADGALVIETPNGVLRHERPVLFEVQQDGSRRPIHGGYRLIGRNEAGFRVGRHHAALPLAIDPVLDSSTFLGGSADDSVVMAADNFAVGNTTSIDFPGAGLGRRRGTCIFIQVSTLTLIYGGAGDTVALAANAVSQFNSTLVVGGYTTAPDLPAGNSVSTGSGTQFAAWQSRFAGGATDGFLLFLYPQSTYKVSSLLTYVGTPGEDKITGVSCSGSYFLAVGTTNGRGLPAATSVTYQGVSKESASGLDGFYLLGMTQLPYNIALAATGYFGGSGDDSPSAALVANYGYYIAGETTSSDFMAPNGPVSVLNGVSDAFLMRIPALNGDLPPAVSVLFGGAGTDRATSLASLKDGTILLGGVTSSPDLPVQSAAQATYGGGDSDGFLAVFAPDLSASLYATYVGGSGTDEITGVAADTVSGGSYAVGWTASSDIPLKQPIQAQFGGGPDDGFFAHYDGSGNLRDASYFGGSGSDRILGAASAGVALFLSGRTTSADLPTRNPTLSNLRGASDGFVARMGVSGFTPLPATGGKDLRAFANFYLGAAGPATVTITSSDPSIVQVADDLTTAGQSSIQLGISASTTAPRGYYFDCLQDSGGADLIFSAPDVASQTAHISCYPASLVIWYPTATSSQNVIPLTAPVALPAGRASSFAFSLGVYLPGRPNPTAYLNLRPGVTPVQVSIANSNPAVGTLSADSVSLQSSSPAVTFTPAGIGETQLSFTATGAGIPVNSVIQLVVSSLAPLNLNPYTVATGFQRAIYPTYSPMDGKALTITSEDPAGLLLSTDWAQPGSPSVTLATIPSSGIWLQAVGSSTGDVTMTYSVPDEAPVSTTVHITSPAVVFPTLGVFPDPLALGVGQSVSAAAGIGNLDGPSYCCYYPIPGKDIALELSSSDPGVIKVDNYSSGNPAYLSVNITGVAPGKSVLSLQPVDGVPVSPASRSINATVTSKPIVLSDLELGYKLAGGMTLTLPASVNAPTPIHLVSSDPSLALLSPNNTSPGQAQLDLTLSSYASLTFYVYGLASSGRARITATLPGGSSATANVILEPSGFGWASDSYSVILYNPSFTPSIYPYVLDAATLIPVAQQVLQPGVTAKLTISNSDSGVVALSTDTYNYGGNLPQMTTKGAGKAVLSIAPPAGFSTPAIRQNLQVTVQVPTLSLSTPGPIGNNLQAQLSMTNYSPQPNEDLPMTATSSDPSRLVISSDPALPGSASATSNIRTGKGIWLQALSDSGVVTVTVTVPTFTQATATITLRPAGIGLNIDSTAWQSGVIAKGGQYLTTLQSPDTGVLPSVFVIDTNNVIPVNYTLRPGISPVQVEFRSSDPSIGAISGSPVALADKMYAQQSGVVFKPVAVGRTEVSVVQPPGFIPVPGYSTATFVVTGPTFTDTALTLARDTFEPVQIGLTGNVKAPTANVTVTLTSSDPSRILLSPDASTPPSGSITQLLIAGRNYFGPFYVHALGNGGMVPVAVTAPGYEPGSINVTLADLAFTFANYFSPLQAILQNGAQTLAVTPAIQSGSNITTGGGYAIRPGASIAVNVASSDSDTVRVDTPQLLFQGGAYQAFLKYTPLQPGSATLSLSVPADYVAPDRYNMVTVNVTAAQLNFNSGGSTALGRDMQSYLGFYMQGNSLPSSLTVTSSDPSLLLLSTDGKSAGASAVTITPTATAGLGGVYVQALSDSGIATLTVSSPGYQSGNLNMTLSPSAAVFGSYGSINTGQVNLFVNAGGTQQPVSLVTLDPLSLQPRGGSGLPRPGANLTVAATSSDPAVVAVTTPTITFDVPDPSKPQSFAVSLQPVGVGTAIVSLGQLPGGGTPATGGQLVFNVVEPSFMLPSFTLGRDLQAPAQLKLGSSVPTPASNLTVSVNANYPLSVSSSPTANTGYFLNLTIPAGQRTTPVFYVQASQTGSAGLQFSGGGYNSSVAATVTRSAFVFKEAAQGQSVAVNSGSVATVNVVPALSPLAVPVLGPLAIRSGASPIVINVTSSAPGILSVTTPQVVLNPSDEGVVVRLQGLAPGEATLTLSGVSAYDFTTTQSQLVVSVK
jgi:hypothetical protein